jgi:hypothetical protein
MSRDIKYIGMDVHKEAIVIAVPSWLYDLLQPQVEQVLVCNPRRNALLKEGSKSDKADASKLAELLRTGMLRPVYHGENGLRTLRE